VSFMGPGMVEWVTRDDTASRGRFHSGPALVRRTAGSGGRIAGV